MLSLPNETATLGIWKVGSCTCSEDHADGELCKTQCKYCDVLFKPPPPPPDCPLCCMPLVFGGKSPTYTTCCGHSFCACCLQQEMKASIDKVREFAARGKPKPHYHCPYCRAPTRTEEEENEKLQKRLDANDPEAFCKLAEDRMKFGDVDACLDSFMKAAKLGCVRACHKVGALIDFKLSNLAQNHEVMEVRDSLLHMKERYLLVGAEKGDMQCHYYLGKLLFKYHNNPTLAYKHYCFAAEHGDTDSSKILLSGYTQGYISKEKYAATLRAYKTANDSIMSPERHEAARVQREFKLKHEMHILLRRLKNNGESQ